MQTYSQRSLPFLVLNDFNMITIYQSLPSQLPFVSEALVKHVIKKKLKLRRCYLFS